MIGLLPLVCLGLLIAGCYQRQPSLLEAVVVGALGWGLAAVMSLELLSFVGKINRLSVIVFWSLISAGASEKMALLEHKNLVAAEMQTLVLRSAIPCTLHWQRVRQPSLPSQLR